MRHPLKRHILPILPLGLAVIGTAAQLQPAFADESAPPRPSIVMEGRGEATTAPDMATINAGVTSTATTAREALDANTKAMAALLETLKAAGIAEADIQTTNFSVNPQYFYADRDQNGNTPPPKITGYQVQNTVDVKIAKLDGLGAILDKIVSDGANTINGISFSVGDSSRLMEEARKAAFADAAAKARTYADAAGVGLGDILSINETGGNAPRPVVFKTLAAAAPAAAVPVQAGQLTYDVDVTVQWLLKGSSDQ